MPKATRISAPIAKFKPEARLESKPESKSEPKQSEGHPLVSIALFCGIGLLVSLVAMLMGVQGAWY
jgi:hypothetical protein